MRPTAGEGTPHGMRSALAAVLRMALGACALAVLAACGSSKTPESPVTHQKAAQAAGRESGSASHADLVAAVSSGKEGVPVQVQFELRQRPEVGRPAELDVEITPTAPLGRLLTSFHAEDGLTIQDGGAAKESDRPEPGVPLSQTLTIVPQRDGIFYVSTTVLVDSGAESVARTFTIPVIAGAGAS